MSHQELTELAEREPPGCGGVNFLPYLTGARTPNWPHARGALLGLGPGSVTVFSFICKILGSSRTMFCPQSCRCSGMCPPVHRLMPVLMALVS